MATFVADLGIACWKIGRNTVFLAVAPVSLMMRQPLTQITGTSYLVKNCIKTLTISKVPIAGFFNKRQGGKDLVWKPQYSSPRRVKLSPKYSSRVKNPKVNNVILILHYSRAPRAGFSDRRRAGEGFDWKREYSSARRVKLSPKYSSPAESRKVKNQASIFHPNGSLKNPSSEIFQQVPYTHRRPQGGV